MQRLSCVKECFAKVSISNHVENHIGKMPFKYKICCKYFVEISTLINHVRVIK